MDHQNEFVELFPDSHLRANGLSRYRPDLRGSLKLLPQDRRLFFSGITLSTFFTKTVTFSVTVPLTLTTTTSCIPLALFAVPIQTSACRRKREILDHVPIIPEEYIQFGIAPSQTQEIILPTAVIPSAEANRSNRQVSVDQSQDQSALSDQLLSSGDVIRGSLSSERHVMRGKRYFILSVTSTTITTYSITSTAATKSVRLAGDMQVLCLPSGYIVC